MSWPCLPWRHSYVQRFDGGRTYLECMHCLKVTKGIEVRPITHKECQEAYEDMMQAELDLHGGG